MGLVLSGGFPLGPLLYYPAYALLYPAFRVEWLIPERYLSLEESVAIKFLLPFIEFFFVALTAMEMRRRRLVAHKENEEQDKQEDNHYF